MSAQAKPATAPLDLSKWRNVPRNLMAGGGVVVALGFVITLILQRLGQFAYSWLLAFMFFLSLCLGAAGPVQVAERAEEPDGRGRGRCRAWFRDHAHSATAGSICLFVAAGIHVFPQLVPGRPVSGSAASSV